MSLNELDKMKKEQKNNKSENANRFSFTVTHAHTQSDT